MIKLLAVVLTLLSTSVYAQHTHEGVVGEFYQNWLRPNPNGAQRSGSCCNQSDCGQVSIVKKNGSFYARGHFRFPNQDVLIPNSVLETNQPDPRESPDGMSHACIPNLEVVCAVLGSGQ